MKISTANPDALVNQARAVPVRRETLLFRALRALKIHGASLPWVILRKSLAKFIRIETLIVYRHDLARFPVELNTGEPVALVIRIDEPSSELLRNLCARYPNGNFQQRFQQEGRRCYVALYNNGVAGYAWVAESSLHIDEIACSHPVAPEEIFVYDCFVDSELRGKGIYPRMLASILEESRDRKLKRVLIAASSVNHASIRGIQKAGFVEWKRIRYVECGGKKKWWGLATDAVPRT